MKIPIADFRIPTPDNPIKVHVDSSAYKTKVHKTWAEKVKDRAGHACQRCGRTKVRLFADHIKEVADGGTWDLANGQALCGSCHTIKTLAARAKRCWSGIA